MTSILKKAVLALAVLLAPALAFGQQNSLLQTTIAADIPSAPSTNPFHSSQTFITVASVPTGVTGIGLNPTTTLNQQNQWQAYIDRELLNVVAINGTTIQVQRGQAGTNATPHKSGTMVLFGRASWFYVNDPGGNRQVGTGLGGASCTAATVFVTPYLNVLTGAQWICSSVTSTWVPGWNNPMGGSEGAIATATVASVAGTTVPSGPLFSVTGTNAIVTWAIPLGFNGTALGGGCFTTIPSSGIWTWTAAGNIATAGTVTAANNVPVTFCWNAVTSKWIPSRIS